MTASDGRRPREISQQESAEFSAAYGVAQLQPNGLFRLSHMSPPPGRKPKWPHRMSEERDCSRLQEKIAASLTAIEETVIDRTRYSLRGKSGETTAIYRTVTAHASSDGCHRLLGAKRRQERGTEETSSLAGEVLGEYLDLIKAHGLDCGSAPLLGLDPELANPDERRLLVSKRIPYAILLEPWFPFKQVLRPLNDDADVHDSIQVEHIFDVYRPKRDRSEINYLEIRDLREFKTSPSRMVREFVVEVPVEDDAVHFVVSPALPPSSRAPERLKESVALARLATERMLERPAERLRVHQFHHPHDQTYCSVLYLVDYGRQA